MTSPYDFTQLCPINKVLLIEQLSMIPQYFESCDVARDFFYLYWASSLHLNLVVIT